jgi:hypothetical protein
VLLATQIAGGSFSISCPNSLVENVNYPTYALYVDLDRDGRCGTADVGVFAQGYGWFSAIDDDVTKSDMVVSDMLPVDQMVGSNGFPVPEFCERYFP